jgi:zinc ribbon protein
MSEPEISRRCTACGVSVRQHAMFCPQCGSAIAQTPVVETAPGPAPKPVVYSEGVRGRVEKLRKVSSVVIDQAAYDPSLRFLLVAAALFLLFLVLLILSKVLG